MGQFGLLLFLEWQTGWQEGSQKPQRPLDVLFMANWRGHQAVERIMRKCTKSAGFPYGYSFLPLPLHVTSKPHFQSRLFVTSLERGPKARKVPV